MYHRDRFSDCNDLAAELFSQSAADAIDAPDADQRGRASSETSHLCSFALGSTLSGLYLLMAGVAMLSAGIFLLTQIATAPPMIVETALFGGFGLAAGLITTAAGIRRLAMRLRLDDSGIALRPGPGGIEIPWSALAGWTLDRIGTMGAGFLELKLWKIGADCPVVIDVTQIPDLHRRRLRLALSQHAPAVER